MNTKNGKRSLRRWAITGDVVIYLIVTLIGFGSHAALGWEALSRMLATFLPFTASWFLIAPWLGVFQEQAIRSRTHLLRVLLAAIFAAPAGATLRGLWLNAPILPVFVLVMAAVSALAMLLWRAVLQFIIAGPDPSR